MGWSTKTGVDSPLRGVEDHGPQCAKAIVVEVVAESFRMLSGEEVLEVGFGNFRSVCLVPVGDDGFSAFGVVDYSAIEFVIRLHVGEPEVVDREQEGFVHIFGNAFDA